ncbi:MAG: neutral amino acid transporter [Candelina submexicana]|nr:MAG: neutral amino acid transporter [Candelina submexicana]
MSASRNSSPSAGPRPMPTARSSEAGRGRSPSEETTTRATSIARLASPVPPASSIASPAVRQVPTPSQLGIGQSGTQSPLPGAEGSSSLPGPGQSALAAALQNSFGRSPPRFGTPPLRPLSPPTAGAALSGSAQQSNYGSFENRSVQGAPGWMGSATLEDPEIVRRHLVQPSNAPSSNDDSVEENEGTPRSNSTPRVGTSSVGIGRSRTKNVMRGKDVDEFSSLKLQGGDVTRGVYRWADQAESQGGRRGQRSQSFHITRPQPQSEELDISSIKLPGGFRRNFLRRVAGSPSPTRRSQPSGGAIGTGTPPRHRSPKLFTSNFMEFLTLYGHFAGEELEEDDEDLLPGEYFASDLQDEVESAGEYTDEDEAAYGEGSGLLTPGRRKRKRKARGPGGGASTGTTLLVLLKSFVGTGVLFLPKAFLNGGMLFSSLVLLGVATVSYYCFILLVNARMAAKDGPGALSFGDLGGKLYGPLLRRLTIFALVLSQIGFASAYIVFTSENLQAFILAVTDCRVRIDIGLIVLMQLIIFLPLSLFRDINKLGFIAVLADLFILVGLIYLSYYDIHTLAVNHGAADIANFNSRDWTLFIGTAIFTFEGVGLIIPIQESMRKPEKFPFVLAIVMIVCTVVFTSMGALSYAAYGSSTKTVILLNMPQDDRFVNAVQLLYSLAILLSTPLQLFPAIRLIETGLFTRSGKYDPKIKWYKNLVRFLMVALCAGVAYGGAGDLDKFVALVGSFACIPLVYILPPALHIKAVEQTRLRFVTNVLLMIIGLLGMGYTSALTISHWIDGVTVKTPGYCDR